QNIRHHFDFPKMADYPGWEGVLRYRHPKYEVTLVPEYERRLREFGARHAVRQLAIPAASYPLSVQLYFVHRLIPPPGVPKDPMKPSEIHSLGNYTFASLSEVYP